MSSSADLKIDELLHNAHELEKNRKKRDASSTYLEIALRCIDTKQFDEARKHLTHAIQLRYADGRQFRLNTLVEMISSLKWTKVSPEERERILDYHKKGFNANQIVSLLYAEFGKVRRSGTIQKAINRTT
ncbi:MAG: hypothetical protein ACXAEN_27005 [Candidatus Thorarchaeota archaeon]|jgi:hypothetical protein